jgi:TM2 domain-containing membrane protein YozV
MNSNILPQLASLDLAEANSLTPILQGMSEEQQTQFMSIYLSKRRDPVLILICTLAGFVCFAGLQRFITDRIGLGLLYFFTGGFLLVGTIIDLFRYKSIARTYNEKIAYQTASILSNFK